MSKVISGWDRLPEPAQFGLVMVFVGICFTICGSVFSILIANMIGFCLTIGGLIYLGRGLGLFGKERRN